MTVALAWGLPDKPTYPEWELMERYENGSLPLLLREDKNVTDANRKGEIKATATPSHHISKIPSYSNYYHNGSDIMNRIANYYKYFQRRKPDSYYFGNSPLNPTNYNKKSYCNNNRNCAQHDERISYYTNDKDNHESNAFNSYNVRPPYSATYDERNRYDAFMEYMNSTYFQPWLESATQMKYTTISPESK